MPYPDIAIFCLKKLGVTGRIDLSKFMLANNFLTQSFFLQTKTNIKGMTFTSERS